MDSQAKIEVMLHEYDSLKQEHRMALADAMKKVAAIFTFVTVVAGYAFERKIPEVFVVLPFVMMAFALYMLNIMHTVWQFGAYFGELERRINKLARADLLRWDSALWWPEHERGERPESLAWLRGRLLGGGYRSYEPYTLRRPFLLNFGPLLMVIVFTLLLSFWRTYLFFVANRVSDWVVTAYVVLVGAGILYCVYEAFVYGTNSSRRQRIRQTIKTALSEQASFGGRRGTVEE